MGEDLPSQNILFIHWAPWLVQGHYCVSTLSSFRVQLQGIYVCISHFILLYVQAVQKQLLSSW